MIGAKRSIAALIDDRPLGCRRQVVDDQGASGHAASAADVEHRSSVEERLSLLAQDAGRNGMGREQRLLSSQHFSRAIALRQLQLKLGAPEAVVEFDNLTLRL